MLKIFLLSGVIGIAACSTVDRADDKTEVVDGNGPKMIAVHSNYCPACLSMKPIINKISDKCDSSDVSISLVNLNDNNRDAIVGNYQIRAIPTYIFIDDANIELSRLVGRQSEAAIGRALDSIGGNNCS